MFSVNKLFLDNLVSVVVTGLYSNVIYIMYHFPIHRVYIYIYIYIDRYIHCIYKYTYTYTYINTCMNWYRYYNDRLDNWCGDSDNWMKFNFRYEDKLPSVCYSYRSTNQNSLRHLFFLKLQGIDVSQDMDLTHRGLVVPCSNIDMSQHSFYV